MSNALKPPDKHWNIDMNVKDLALTESFIVVAEELNFRRSAERLNLDQSALTRRVQKLESLLGFALLNRTTRQVSLTPAGRSFYENCTRLIEEYRVSVQRSRRIAEGKAGTLRIGYMAFAATKLMPRAVSAFKLRYPLVDISLSYMGTQRQKLALAADEIDFGYVIGPFDHSEYHSLPLSSDPLYVVMPRNHPLARRRKLHPADIGDCDLIFGSLIEWEAYYARIDGLFRDKGIQLKTQIEASNTLALIGLVAAGMGVTIYPESIIGFLGGSIEVRPIASRDFKIETVLAWKRINRTKSVRNFVREAKKSAATPSA